MNDKIKAIMEKHFNMDLLTNYDAKDLNNAIIEICEEQILACREIATDAKYSKNIAQLQPKSECNRINAEKI